jgi:hypothetical protein
MTIFVAHPSLIPSPQANVIVSFNVKSKEERGCRFGASEPMQTGVTVATGDAPCLHIHSLACNTSSHPKSNIFKEKTGVIAETGDAPFLHIHSLV